MDVDGASHTLSSHTTIFKWSEVVVIILGFEKKLVILYISTLLLTDSNDDNGNWRIEE